MESIDLKDYLSTEQAARELQLSISGIRQLVLRNILPKRYWAGRLIFTKKEVKAADGRNKKRGPKFKNMV